MRDEIYIINLCDLVLGRVALRQYKFDFLKGDKAERISGKIVKVLQEKGVKLPVDAYYADEEYKLVVEYLEKQHFEPNGLMDNRPTCSNVLRGEQRKIYDKRRRKNLLENGVHLIEIPYCKFAHRTSGKLIRNEANDEAIIHTMLSEFL